MILIIPYSHYYWVGGPPHPYRVSEEKLVAKIRNAAARASLILSCLELLSNRIPLVICRARKRLTLEPPVINEDPPKLQLNIEP